MMKLVFDYERHRLTPMSIFSLERILNHMIASSSRRACVSVGHGIIISMSSAMISRETR